MPVVIRRVLFPTDFSTPAQQAQDYACAVAEKFGAELHVLHVISDPAPVPGSKGSWALPDDIQERAIREAELELDTRIEASMVSGCEIVRAVKMGRAVDEIVAYAKQFEIDLIVMGTHGHTGLSHLLLGSVAEKLVRMATCPVLTVHPPTASNPIHFIGHG